KEENASLVLWGWYVTSRESVRVTLHVEVLNEPLVVGDRRKSEDTWQSPDFGGFAFQLNLISKARFIALFTSGSVHYRKGDFEGAIPRFSDALAEHPTQSEM